MRGLFTVPGTLKNKYSFADYLPAVRPERESGGCFFWNMSWGGSPRNAMTGSRDNDTSVQSQSEREKTVVGNEGSPVRSTGGLDSHEARANGRSANAFQPGAEGE